MSQLENPPAFPQHLIETRDGSMQASYDVADGAGLSLRDYFASSALQGLIAKGMNDGKQWDSGYTITVAVIAYAYADQMLRARAAQAPADVQRRHLGTFGR